MADLSREDEVERTFAEIKTRLGELDVVVNCAGITGNYRPIEVGEKRLGKVIDVNLGAVWLCEKAAIKQFLAQDERPLATGLETKARGNIVNIASMLGTITMPHASLYVMSKYSVISLTKTDALNYANKGIRVNAVCAGFIQTSLLDEKGWKALAPLYAVTLMGRLGIPEEVAYVVTFLASDRGSFVTGPGIIAADGGYTVK